MIHNYTFYKTMVALCMVCSTNWLKSHFDTLEQLQNYAATHVENIKSDNNNADYPDFTTAYEQKKPTLFKTITNFFSRDPIPQLDGDSFKTLLEEVQQSRAKRGTKTTQTIALPTQSTVVFWGSMYGSYHSLVRTLTELYHQKIVDTDLKIIKQDCYFAFLGDAINFSPYSLETLTVILTLMKKNPDTVIYLQGQQEQKGFWENFNIRYALKTIANHLLTTEDHSIPLSTTLKNFFKTLPEILVLRNSQEKDQAFYAAHVISEKILRSREIEAALFGERELGSATNSGLQFIGYEHGSAIWSLMSCPNLIYQNSYKFYYDSFVIFEMGEKLLQSTMTVFNQDIRKKEGFIPESFDILYAIPLKEKTDVKKIHQQRPLEIGSSLPLSGGEGIVGRTLAEGINASMYKYNKTDASSLNLFVRNSIFDDRHIPRSALSNVKTLHDDYKVDYVLAPVGTSTLGTYLSTLEKEHMFVFFPFTGWTGARNPLLKNIINIRASYPDEAEALVNYMITEYRSKRFAFFYQNDTYGQNALEGAHRALKKKGVTSWTDIPYNPEQVDFALQIEQIKKTKPDALCFFSDNAPTQEFINQIGTDFFVGINICAISFLANTRFKITLKQQGLKCTFSTVFPDPTTSDIPLFKEYRDAMDRLGLRYSPYSLEGYIATELFLDALIHVKPTMLCDQLICSIAPQEKGALMNYLESLKNYNFKGLNLTFNPKNRSFNLPVWIETEDGQWINTENNQKDIV